MNWRAEPYKSAKAITENEIEALKLIKLVGQAKAIGLSEEKEIEAIIEFPV